MSEVVHLTDFQLQGLINQRAFELHDERMRRVAQEEREECAKVCEQCAVDPHIPESVLEPLDFIQKVVASEMAARIARLIRARETK